MMKRTSHTANIGIRIIAFLMTSFVIGSVMGQTKRALVIGISDYQQLDENSWGAIHGANDAGLITPVLKNQGFKSTVICNEAATAKRIRKELGKLGTACKPGDIVYIHFSCHGQPFEDMDGDEEDGWDESIIPFDARQVFRAGEYEGENHITDDELYGYIHIIRHSVGAEGFVCLVVDACHAGGSSRGDGYDDNEDELFMRGTSKSFSPSQKEFRPRINTQGAFQIAQENGLADIVVLEACRSYQSNYEIKQDGEYYGPLSYYLSQVLDKQEFTCSMDWITAVKNMMNSDRRLTRQNMVYETSIK